jgi:nitrate reductase NapE
MRMHQDMLPKMRTRGQELAAFLFLTVVLFPLLAVGIVSAYGFLVWLSQIINGPPGV